MLLLLFFDLQLKRSVLRKNLKWNPDIDAALKGWKCMFFYQILRFWNKWCACFWNFLSSKKILAPIYPLIKTNSGIRSLNWGSLFLNRDNWQIQKWLNLVFCREGHCLFPCSYFLLLWNRFFLVSRTRFLGLWNLLWSLGGCFWELWVGGWIIFRPENKKCFEFQVWSWVHLLTHNG